MLKFGIMSSWMSVMVTGAAEVALAGAQTDNLKVSSITGRQSSTEGEKNLRR